MSASLAFRVASVVAVLQWAAHTTMFVRATPKHGAEEAAVVQAMQSHRFDFAGASRSYWDFYYGYGLMAAFVVLIEAVLFWQLAGAATTAPALTRSIAALFLAFNIGHALLAARYFFVTPIVPDVLIAVCLAAGVIALSG